jgi:hypothetical protein
MMVTWKQKAIFIFFKLSVNINFVCETLTIQPATLTDGQVVSERNIFLLFGIELDNVHCDVLLPVGEE